MRLNFDDIFQSYMDGNQKVWAHDRRETVGASEVFGCLRQTWFKKRGHEFHTRTQVGTESVEEGVTVIDGVEYPAMVDKPIYESAPIYPEDEVDEDDGPDWGATERGNILEAHFVVPALSNLPRGKMLLGGADQKTFFHGKNSATPDGLIIGLDRDALADYGIPDIETHCILLEIKSIDPRVALQHEKAIHRGQTITQIGMIREKTPYKPVYGVILYVNASFLSNIKPFVVKYDQETWDVAQLRADAIYQTSDPALIQAEGKIDGSCDFCKFQRSCGIVTTGRIPDDNSKLVNADAAILEQFDTFIERYKEAKEFAEKSAKDFEMVKAEMREEMILVGSRKLGGKKAKRPYSVSWYGQKGRRTLSKALIKEALGEDLSAYETEGNAFDVLRVTFSDD